MCLGRDAGEAGRAYPPSCSAQGTARLDRTSGIPACSCPFVDLIEFNNISHEHSYSIS